VHAVRGVWGNKWELEDDTRLENFISLPFSY